MAKKAGVKAKPDPVLAATFGQNLASVIDTNAELAGKIGVSATAVGEYIKGVALPRADILLKISQVTGKSMAWLLTGVEETPVKSPDKLLEELTKRVDLIQSAVLSSKKTEHEQWDKIIEIDSILKECFIKGDVQPLGRLSGSGIK